MSDKTRIEWTDATWNPVTGCTKVSDGCKHCYAKREWVRLSAQRSVPNRYTGRLFTDVKEHYDIIDQPLFWRKPRRIFVNSMSDLFHPDVSDRFIADVFGVMAACPQHTFQVLTKRPERMRKLLGAGCMGRFEADAEECAALYTDAIPDWPLPNVWLGVSVEDQATADERIPPLLQTPAAVRWVSAEPLLGAVDLDEFMPCSMHLLGCTCGSPAIDWLVVGGESGPKARPMHPDWVRSLRDQAVDAAVPFLFKQWGEWAPRRPGNEQDGLDGITTDPAIDMWPCGYIAKDSREFRSRPESTDGVTRQAMWRVGKKDAGRLLDGIEHNGYPD